MAQPAAERKQLLNVVSLQLANTGLEVVYFPPAVLPHTARIPIIGIQNI